MTSEVGKGDKGGKFMSVIWRHVGTPSARFEWEDEIQLDIKRPPPLPCGLYIISRVYYINTAYIKPKMNIIDISTYFSS